MINQFNEKGDLHGYWEEYYPNGQLCSKGNYINGRYDGYWEDYWSNGNLWNKGYYINDNEVGYWEWYHREDGKLYAKEFIII